jgi:hypothetical protein
MLATFSFAAYKAGIALAKSASTTTFFSEI